MQNEKIEKIMNELYSVKAEITSSDISLKRGYLLYKKVLLIATLFTKVLIEIEKERKDKNRKHRIKVFSLISFAFSNLFIIMWNAPLAILNIGNTLLILTRMKKYNELVKEKTEYNETITRYADLIDNVQEILASKISKMENTEEEKADYSKEIFETPIKELFSEQVISMFVKEDNLTLEEFEDKVANAEFLKDITKLKLTKTNH